MVWKLYVRYLFKILLPPSSADSSRRSFDLSLVSSNSFRRSVSEDGCTKSYARNSTASSSSKQVLEEQLAKNKYKISTLERKIIHMKTALEQNIEG